MTTKTNIRKYPIGMGGGDLYGGLREMADPRIKPITEDTLTAGCMLFYDKKKSIYCVVAASAVAAVLADYDTNRYTTNGDTYLATISGVDYFCARDDAYSQSGMYQSDAAATSCFYRIEIDSTANGSITFSAASGNASIASTTISWSAGDTMASIVAQFTAKNASYITFAALADGSGVGLEIGGYGANTLTATDTTSCSVVDCSKLAMRVSENPTIAVGGTYDPSGTYTYIGNVHHNFRGATAKTNLGNTLVGDVASCICNTGYNYSYRSGINFAGWKSWASGSGSAMFVSDGVNGSAQSSMGSVMSKAAFEANVVSTAAEGSNEAKMYEYYNHLFGDTTGEYATLRAQYESWYGVQMANMYEAYLMSHMVKIDATSGCVNSYRNKGVSQTSAKADVLNVTYDYKFVPAYPPEYNAKHYGDDTKQGFGKGVYHHPAPDGLSLIYRDDNMVLVNANITAYGSGTALVNGSYRGSCASYDAYNSWTFHGTTRCLHSGLRYSGVFRSRPLLALSRI